MPSGAGAPTLEMIGCAPSHDTVATFVAALEDIDGVTRVGLDNSTIAAESAAPAAGEAGECTGPDQKTTFGLKAVFDGFVAAAAPTAPAAPVAPAAADTSQPTAEGGTNSVEEQVGEAQNATNIVPGAAR